MSKLWYQVESNEVKKCPSCGFDFTSLNQNKTNSSNGDNNNDKPYGAPDHETPNKGSHYYYDRYHRPPVNDSGNIGYGFLGFCFPIVGLILYLVWKDDQPRNASAAGKGAIIGVLSSVILWFLYMMMIGMMVY